MVSKASGNPNGVTLGGYCLILLTIFGGRTLNNFYDIDRLDGCVYECPIYPGVWSDWCCKRNCDSYLNKTDMTVCCNGIDICFGNPTNAYSCTKCVKYSDCVDEFVRRQQNVTT